MTKTRSLGPLILCALLGGCGGMTTANTDIAQRSTPTVLKPSTTTTAVADSCPTHTPDGLAPTATPPAPTPIPVGAWKTYANTFNHYTVEYPATWRTYDTSATTNVFSVRNYDSAAFPTAAPPPPYNGVEVSGFPNPDQKSPLELYLYQRANAEVKLSPCSQTTQTATVGGRRCRSCSGPTRREAVMGRSSIQRYSTSWRTGRRCSSLANTIRLTGSRQPSSPT